MAKFIYRMQGILNVKEKMEDQAKNDFSIANAELLEEENKLEMLWLRLEGYENELKRLYKDTLDVRLINENLDAVENMKYQIRIQKLRVKTAQRNVEEKRVKLQEAMQDRKTHEKLRENEFEQFLKDEAAAESKEIDELVSYRFGQLKRE